MPKKLFLQFPKLFDYQVTALTDPRPLKVLCWGAQAGKTRFSMYVQSAYVLSRDKKKSVWVTRDGKFARDEFNAVKELLPKALVAQANKSDLFYKMRNGSEWWFFSGLEPDAFRGRTWSSAVFNEASYCDPEGWHNVVSPRLRGWAIFNFTPKGQRNWSFTDLWRVAGNDPKNWFRSHVKTTDNPTIAPGFLEAFKARMPDAVYRQEILAEFVSDFGRYFNPKPICWTGKFEPYQKGARYAAGLDWAEINDFSALAIRRIDCLPHRLVYFGRLPHMEYVEQIAPLAAKLKEYGNPMGLADASQTAANQLMRKADCNIQDFKYTGPSKQFIVDQLRIEFEQGGIVMPGKPERVKELIATGKVKGATVPVYTPEQFQQVDWLDDEVEFFEPYLSGGKLKLGARGQHHDDNLNAIMLSGEAARNYKSSEGAGFLVVNR